MLNKQIKVIDTKKEDRNIRSLIALNGREIEAKV